MKLHRNLAAAVVSGLEEILLEKKQADVTVANFLQSNKSWGARDRNFIADNIYSIVRYKRLYEFCLEEEVWSVGTLWKILGTKLILENFLLPEWSEFSGLSSERIVIRNEEAKGIRAIRESIPDWLDELGEKELGENWEKEIHALNMSAKLCIRVNTLKTNKGIIKRMFSDEGIEFSENESAPDAVILHSRKNFRNYIPYKNGLFEVQDVSSQLVSQFLEVKPSIKVIDGCAGAGGKSLHIAALMQNKGEILAVDVHTNKLEELERRAVRAGCKIITAFPAEKLSFNKQSLLQNSADRILLDVPCSGLGVLRRKPDTKWSLTLKFIEELKQTQAQILDEYAPMLKSSGVLVYSTCSILPSENEEQVKKFLQRNINFELIEEKSISAAESGFDGFYMAKLKRK